MGKGSNFFGQPIYGQLIKLLNREKILENVATIVRIVLMYYLNLEKFLNNPDADARNLLLEAS